MTEIYQAYQGYEDLSDPMRALAGAAAPMLGYKWLGWPDSLALHRLSAACDVFSCTRLTHQRPAFGISSVEENGCTVSVHEEVVERTPFCTLLRFRKESKATQPRILLVAPMSGHFATLLRGTVTTLLRDHDVYITDWHNARDVALSDGRFGVDEYVAHLIRFIEKIGPGTHLVAVCQPAVAALAAVSLMAAEQHPAQPSSMTLMAGPIDTRINPTAVNHLAKSKPIAWFEDNLVSTVPGCYVGSQRQVYPGFLQLNAFMNMNLERHLKAFQNLYNYLVEGEDDKANVIKAFYAEYFAMSDLAAEFYLETVQSVFQDHALPLGEMQVLGRTIEPAAIRRTALFTVEGEMDDICAVGQTVAAQDMCSGIRPYMKEHHVQTGVGHYGVFNGRRWDTEIYPRLHDFIYSHQ